MESSPLLEVRQKRVLEPISLVRMGIPRRYWSLTRSSFLDRTIYYQALHDYIVGMRTVLDEGRSLFIHGATGSGKSALAAYIARVYAEYGVGVCYASASLIHTEIDQRTYDAVDEVQMERYYREVDLLVIDGLGLELGIVRRGSLIPQIFEDRFQAMRPTIITSSILEPSELDKMALYPHFFVEKLWLTCTLINCS